MSSDPSQSKNNNNSSHQNRRSSFLGSLLSNITTTTNAVNTSDLQRPDPSLTSSISLSSSTGSSRDYNNSLSSPVPMESFSSGSPNSSISSPAQEIDPSSKIYARHQPSQPHQRSFSTSPASHISSNTTPRRASLSNGWPGFRWPGSFPQPTSEQTQPIPIPESTSATDHQFIGNSSLPARRSTVAYPFRRAFELPNYSSVYEDSQGFDSNRSEQTQPLPSQPVGRGRSGSMLSSFGFYETQEDSSNLDKRSAHRHRRKLSPMGERMIRDHPF